MTDKETFEPDENVTSIVKNARQVWAPGYVEGQGKPSDTNDTNDTVDTRKSQRIHDTNDTTPEITSPETRIIHYLKKHPDSTRAQIVIVIRKHSRISYNWCRANN